MTSLNGKEYGVKRCLTLLDIKYIMNVITRNEYRKGIDVALEIQNNNGHKHTNK